VVEAVGVELIEAELGIVGIAGAAGLEEGCFIAGLANCVGRRKPQVECRMGAGGKASEEFIKVAQGHNRPDFEAVFGSWVIEAVGTFETFFAG